MSDESKRKPQEILMAGTALLVLALVGILAYRFVRTAPQDVCGICERPIHAETAFRLETEKDSLHACCPRCGIHYELQNSGTVPRAWATDLHSKEKIPAEEAFYVEGGSVEYCTLHQDPVKRTSQTGSAVRTYDRCLPNLVAFRTAGNAEAYRTRYGGRVLRYEEVRESIRRR